jgi:tRNA (guanine-N7-)-methyltransferase
MPNKIEKFNELITFPNCYTFLFPDLQAGFPMKGKWKEDHFKNDSPVTLELGCGKGEYTIGLAAKHPEVNFIGVDIKGNRIWTGAKEAITRKFGNVAFLRTRIDFIHHCFSANEVHEIWITFPDPQPQKTRERKRLTHMMFIERYRQFLKPGGIIHLKTDSTSLYEYTLRVISDNGLRLLWHTADLYRNCPPDRRELTDIKTYYEQLFTSKGEDIKYISFTIN